jgi:hypothetical protein
MQVALPCFIAGADLVQIGWIAMENADEMDVTRRKQGWNGQITIRYRGRI